MNLNIPTEYGGLGLKLVRRDAGRRGAQLGLHRHRHLAGRKTASGQVPFCSPAATSRRATWLPPLLEEPILCSFGLSEPEAGLRRRAPLKTTAERRGDEYVLNGSKTFITNAGYAAWTVCLREDRRLEGASRGSRRSSSRWTRPASRSNRISTRWGQRANRHLGLRAPGRCRPGREPPGRGGRTGSSSRCKTLDFTRPGTAIGAVGVRRRVRARGRVRERSASRSTFRSRCTRASTS